MYFRKLVQEYAHCFAEGKVELVPLLVWGNQDLPEQEDTVIFKLANILLKYWHKSHRTKLPAKSPVFYPLLATNIFITCQKSLFLATFGRK